MQDKDEKQESEQGDIYSISADTEGESLRNAEMQKLEEPILVSESNDVYGLAPTEKPAALHPNRVTELSPGEGGSEDELDHPLTMEEIYERKRKERSQQGGGETLVFEQRPVLPPHPFLTRFFIPFVMPGFFIRLGIMVCSAWFPFYLATRLFTRRLEQHYDMSGKVMELSGFISCIFEDSVSFFLFCFLWGIFSIPYSLYIFEATAEGDDRISDWPEFNVIGGIGQFIWLGLLLLIGSVPGYFLLSFFGVSGLWGGVMSTILLLPVFFLSCSETDTLFTLVTKNILRSLVRLSRCWLVFYGISIFLFWVMITIAILALWMTGMGENSRYGSLLISLVISFLFTIIPLFYLRLLGRLGWVIEDFNRKLQEAEENEEDQEES